MGSRFSRIPPMPIPAGGGPGIWSSITIRFLVAAGRHSARSPHRCHAIRAWSAAFASGAQAANRPGKHRAGAPSIAAARIYHSDRGSAVDGRPRQGEAPGFPIYGGGIDALAWDEEIDG